MSGDGYVEFGWLIDGYVAFPWREGDLDEHRALAKYHPVLVRREVGPWLPVEPQPEPNDTGVLAP